MIHPSGWNTWDVAHTNAAVHLPSGVRIIFGLYDLDTGEHRDHFDWRSGTVRPGHHSGDGRYATIVLRWHDLEFTVEYAADGDRLACRLSPHNGHRNLLLSVEIDRAWDDGLARTTMRATQPARDYNPPPFDEDMLFFDFFESIVISVTFEAAMPTREAERLVNQQRNITLSESLRTDGWLGASAEGLTRVINWNTIWEPGKGRICTPVSRDWCKGEFGHYVLFEWDTFFCAVMAGLYDPELAKANIRAILQEITPRGFIPNFGSARGASEDRSQPPVGAYSVLKLYRSGNLSGQGDRAFLVEVFGPLLRWHNWWMPNRDGNGDGLLEWGSDPARSGFGGEVFTLQAARYESGLDNSPMWDGVGFNERTHTMVIAAVGLNALYALDAWALAEIADIIGRDRDAARLRQEYADMAGRINADLWNEEAGIYQNRFWNGRFSPVLSSTVFFPLLAGIVPPDRAERMVNTYLLDERHFWGEHVLPTIARSDPTFDDQDYWRGRVWGPHNYLVYEGLRRAGYREVAHEMARRSVNTFLAEWEKDGHVHENYDAISGYGESDPMYTWGALMAYTGIQELVDAPAWDGWHFGCSLDEPAEIRGMVTASGVMSVTCRPDGLTVTLDGQTLLATDHPALIEAFICTNDRMTFTVYCDTGPLNLTVGCLPQSKLVQITTGHITEQRQTNGSGEVTLRLDAGQAPVEVLMQHNLRQGHFHETYNPAELVYENHFRSLDPAPVRLPLFNEVRDLLPQPFWDGHESALAAYWKAWELAFANLRNPTRENGFVSPYIDTAFNDNLFMWDSVFILLFALYGRRAFNFQGTLDNFYAKQHPDGYICREIREHDGTDAFQRFDVSSTGPNIMPWAEWDYYCHTGDRLRLAQVFPVLLGYYRWFRTYRTWRDGSYFSSGWGSGMDNLPRLDDFSHGHLALVDTTAQQVFAGRILLQMAAELGRDIPDVAGDVATLTGYINTHMWSNGFYHDLDRHGQPLSARHIGAYWTLLAAVVPPEYLDTFVTTLEDANSFNRVHRVPALAANHIDYNPDGGYWRGSVWPPTNYMVLRGLTANNQDALAFAIAYNHVRQVVAVYEATGSLWENYAPERPAPGQPAKPDFVGWSGLPPIAVLFEYLFGLRPHRDGLMWDIRLLDAHGVTGYPIGPNISVDLQVAARRTQSEQPVIEAYSTAPLTLEVRWSGGSETLRL